jgi:tRNA (uracil-5-)-methyltransferase TRM9
LRTRVDAEEELNLSGQDVFVPWVSSPACRSSDGQDSPKTRPGAIQRYYHMFDKGELGQLVQTAAREMGLKVGPLLMNEADECEGTEGVEIITSGWERSNYYLELRRWRK